jgi:hypothetical protein
MHNISEPALPAIPESAHTRAGFEVRAILLVLLVLEAFFFSALADQPPERCLQNALFAGIAFAWLAWLHKRWRLEMVMSRLKWLGLLNLLLALVSLVHWVWLNEDTSDFGTGISDAHYVLEVLRGTAAEHVSGYVGGYAAWLYPIVTVFGIDNFYMIALVNTVLIALAGLVLACLLREMQAPWRAVPVMLFLFHPYSVVLAATIYKDPLIICATLMVFAGVCLESKRRTSNLQPSVRKPTALLAAGLVMAILGRPAYALVLILFVGTLFFLQAARTGRIGRHLIQIMLGAGLVMVLGIVATSYFDMLPVILNSLRRIYDPTAVADLTATTGNYAADQASIGVRFMSGPLLQRIALLPMLLVMQLVSPFPPRLMSIDNVYIWVEQCFGVINLSIAPLLAAGLIASLRSADRTIKLVPLYSFFVLMPAIAFGGVVGRQLAPIVPFLFILAWVGWRSLPTAPVRLLAILAAPVSWALAFGAYAYLRSL